MRPVVLYLQPGSVPQTRQAADCLAHCNLRRYRIVAVVLPLGQRDAVRTVLDGDADLVVAAYSARSRPGDLRDLATSAGVRVEYVRPPVVRREIGQLIRALAARHGTHSVAEELGVTSQEIRIAIARLDASREPPASRGRGGRRQNGT
jgi:hypothetical protein